MQVRGGTDNINVIYMVDKSCGLMGIDFSMNIGGYTIRSY